MEAKRKYHYALRATFVLLCALLVAFVWHGFGSGNRLGPGLPAVSGDTLWIESHGALHQLDREGRQLQSITLTDLRLSGKPGSLQFTSPDVFWIYDRGRVNRCELARRTCVPLMLEGLSRMGIGRRWVRTSDDESEIVVSDTSEHRVLIYQRNAAGGYDRVRTLDQGLHFPNQTLQVGDQLWVANTNGFEIATFEAGGSSVAPTGHYPIAQSGLRPGHKFPFAMARDAQGQVWVLVADTDMRHADVLVLDEHLVPQRTVRLSDEQDPDAIVAFDGDLLATDLTNFRIDRISPQGQVLAPFGDEAFAAELQKAHDRYRLDQKLPTYLITGTLSLLALALWFAKQSGELETMNGKRWPTPGIANPPAVNASTRSADTRPRHITRVRAIPGATRMRRYILLIVGILSLVATGILLCIALPYLHADACSPDWDSCRIQQFAGTIPLILFCVLMALLCAQVWLGLRNLEKMEIATDGKSIVVRLRGKTHKALAAQMTCTPRLLLMGMRGFPLCVGSDRLFDEQDFVRNILERLPQLTIDNSSLALLRHQWNKTGALGKRQVIALLACMALALFAMLADTFLRH